MIAGNADPGVPAVRTSSVTPRRVVLRQRPVDERARLFRVRDVLAVPYHADDLQDLPRIGHAERPQSLTDGIGPRPETPGQRFVDDRHSRRPIIVSIGEVASREHGDLHRLEVTRSDRIHVHRRREGLPFCRIRVSFTQQWSILFESVTGTMSSAFAETMPGVVSRR